MPDAIGSRVLILPAEEANVYLGGHWALFFPRPVYWYHVRPEGRAFVTVDPRRGNVYSIGSAADMLELVRREHGRPDVADAPENQGIDRIPRLDPQHGALPAPALPGRRLETEPSDLSSPRLGERPFRLLDDMSNWGLTKNLIGEVDVLIPEHSIEAAKGGAHVRARLRWTFPLKMAEVVWGDGVSTYRHTISLEETAAFGKADYDWTVPAKDWTWMRLAVWDAAGNGAFTMPVRRER